MSANDFLVKMGLFTRPDFLDRATCHGISRRMAVATALPAEVYISESATAVDLEARRALSVSLAPDDIRPIERALDALRPELSRHFHVGLAAPEPAEFLVYGPGAFFAPHRDRPRTSGVAAEVAGRRVSAVIFLSVPPPAADAGYTGGDLRFYRLIDGPGWEEAGFACDPAPGLLIAFPSDTLHEVTPVATGRRCTAVTWFGASD